MGNLVGVDDVRLGETIPTRARSTGLKVEIERVLNGYVVRTGCQTVVFETTEKLLSELERYLKDPKEVEIEYLRKGK